MEAAGKRWITHPSRSDTIKIWAIADTHLGNKGATKELLVRDVEKIKNDPYSFWIGAGDYLDCISPSDKRFDADCVDPEIIKIGDLNRLGKALAESAVKYFDPIKDKCLGMCFGNHEEKYMHQKEQSDLHAWMCHELGVPNLRYSSMLGLMLVRMPKVKKPRLFSSPPPSKDNCMSRRYKVLVHHGAGGAATKSGRASRLEKFAQLTAADICFVAHSHDTNVMPVPLLDLNEPCTKIIERKRLAIMTGSYLRGYASGQTSYAEKRGYPPTTLGAVAASIETETGALSSEVRA